MHPALVDLPAASPTQASWFHHGEQLLALVEQHCPLVTVELGTWRGGSAIALARVVRAWGGVVYCVDPWASGPGYPTIHETAAHMTARGVAASIRLIVAASVEAAACWRGPIDCLYIDADHTYDAVSADLTAWWPYLIRGGLIAGDDYQNPHYPGVTRAWDDFETAVRPCVRARERQGFARVATPDTDPPGMALIYGVKT
jgi:predicted O-methyltransferase YrrM